MKPEGRKRNPWAVLAYTVADDRSDGDAIDASARKELHAICQAADYFGEMDVAAQVDFKRSRGVFRGVIAEALQKKRRYEGFKAARAESHPFWRDIEGKLKHSRLRLLEEDVDLNAARANVLRDFLRFGREECPADQYVLFFYGHGYGPAGVFFDADAGEDDADTLQMSGLANSVEAIGDSAAVVVFRVCEVNTLETAYQLKDAAKFMIASQSVVPIAGVWPWETFMSGLFPGAEPGDVAQSIVRQLSLFLRAPENRTPFADVPYTLIDLAAAPAVAKPLKALANALDAARDSRACASACSRALEAARVGFPDDPRNPGDPALLDVPTLCDGLQRLTRYPAVSGPARALGEVVAKRLVKWHSSRHGLHRGAALFYKPTTRHQVKHSHLYDEDNAAKDARNYRRLALSQATGWDRIALRPLG
jgi:hypothetical protein